MDAIRDLSDSALAWLLLISFAISTILIVAFLAATALLLTGRTDTPIYVVMLGAAFPFAGLPCLLFSQECQRRDEGAK